MRQLYAWHTAALAGQEPQKHDGEPQCGWYRTKLVKGGPWVPVEIKCERDIDVETAELESDEKLIAIVDGERRDPGSIWVFSHPISKAEFEALHEAREINPRMRATMAPMDLTEGAARP